MLAHDMRYLPSFLLICSLFLLHAHGQQEEREPHRTVAGQFEKNYNAEDYEAIFAAFGGVMQDALPLSTAKTFFSGVKNQYGNIAERGLVTYLDAAALYKVRCERGTFMLTLTVDADSKIIGLFVRPSLEVELPKRERTETKMILPFKGEWTLVWGGDTPEQNYHITAHPSQRHAMDFVIQDENGRSYHSSGQNNEDYYAFGKELISPCDGEIVLVVEGVKDNQPGQFNPFFPTGNTVVLKTDNLEYLVFAHFKQHSIKVTQGQRVKQGSLLGLCGNSGNSSEAHLHFHVQNEEDMNMATGVKCYFAEIMVNGEQRKDYAPIRNERVRN